MAGRTCRQRWRGLINGSSKTKAIGLAPARNGLFTRRERSMTKIKLYRGLKTGSFTIIDQDMASQHSALWHQILTHRHDALYHDTQDRIYQIAAPPASLHLAPVELLQAPNRPKPQIALRVDRAGSNITLPLSYRSFCKVPTPISRNVRKQNPPGKRKRPKRAASPGRSPRQLPADAGP